MAIGYIENAKKNWVCKGNVSEKYAVRLRCATLNRIYNEIR